jgi:hypothetical protein
MAEREGFEPPIGLHLCRISSAVHSTTLPPLLKAPNQAEALWSGPCSRRGRRAIQGAARTNSVGREKRSWDRHTRAQIGGPMPQMLTSEGTVSVVNACGASKLATARAPTTPSRIKPYRSRLPWMRAQRGTKAVRRVPGPVGDHAGPRGGDPPPPQPGERACVRCRMSAKPFIFGRFLPRFALTPGPLPL